MSTPQQSGTPRTDAAASEFIGQNGHAGVSVHFARQLERELAAARAEVERLKAWIADPAALHAHCVRTLSENQVAHLFGERMTVIQNDRDALRAQLQAKEQELAEAEAAIPSAHFRDLSEITEWETATLQLAARDATIAGLRDLKAAAEQFVEDADAISAHKRFRDLLAEVPPPKPDALAVFPSDRGETLVEVFSQEGDPAFVCGLYGRTNGDMIEQIEKDLNDNPEFMEKGDGRYLYRVAYEDAQIGNEGRIELPAYWDLSLIAYMPPKADAGQGDSP